MIKPVRRRDGQDGFTIIEVMIALAILCMGILSGVSLHFGTARNNTNGDVITQATMLAKTQLETLKSLNIADLNANTVNNCYVNVLKLVNGTYVPDYALSGERSISLEKPKINADGIFAGPQAGGIFRRYWTIENLGTDARRITVTVECERIRMLGGERRVVISSNTQGNGV